MHENFPPVPARRSGTLADRAYATLRSAIVDGTYPPGTRLVEPDLADAFKISRTPLREALGRLQQEGWIEGENKLGRFVSRLSDREVMELVDLRALLEGFAAGLTARNATDEQLDQIEDACSQGEEHTRNGDLDALVASNTSFHSAIVDFSRSQRLISLIHEFDDWTSRFRPQAIQVESVRELSTRQHREIVLALRARDSVKVEALMRTHIHDTGNIAK